MFDAVAAIQFHANLHRIGFVHVDGLGYPDGDLHVHPHGLIVAHRHLVGDHDAHVNFDPDRYRYGDPLTVGDFHALARAYVYANADAASDLGDVNRHVDAVPAHRTAAPA